MKPSLKELSQKILALQKTGTTKINRVLAYYSGIFKISTICGVYILKNEDIWASKV